MTSEGHFSSTDVTLCAQLTRDLLAIAKFLVMNVKMSTETKALLSLMASKAALLLTMLVGRWLACNTAEL